MIPPRLHVECRISCRGRASSGHWTLASFPGSSHCFDIVTASAAFISPSYVGAYHWITTYVFHLEHLAYGSLAGFAGATYTGSSSSSTDAPHNVERTFAAHTGHPHPHPPSKL